jgi:hypothetical protein
MTTISQCQAAAKSLVSKFDSEGVISEEDIVKIIQGHCVIQVVTTEKKKRGRPVGSKNKNKKKEDEKEEKPVGGVVEKKKRGRPAGSKNKNKKNKDQTVEVKPVEEVVVEKKKKRGRPTGSKNKNKKKVEEKDIATKKPKRSALYKTLKREQAATTIQKYARRFTVDYQVMLTRHTEH